MKKIDQKKEWKRGKTQAFTIFFSTARAALLVKVKFLKTSLNVRYRGRLHKGTGMIAISRVLRVISDWPTDRQTDQPTDQPTDPRTVKGAYRVACTRLKTLFWIGRFQKSLFLRLTRIPFLVVGWASKRLTMRLAKWQAMPQINLSDI